MERESDRNTEFLTEPFLTSDLDDSVEAPQRPRSNEDMKKYQQQVFLLLQQRKRQRKLYGSYARTSTIFAISLFTFTIIVIISNAYIVRNDQTGILKVKTNVLLPKILFLTVGLVVVNTIAVSLLKELLTWVLLYIPLIFSLVELSLIPDDGNFFSPMAYIIFACVEVFVLFVGIVEVFVIPYTINSQYFARNPIFMEKLWSMSYDHDNWSINYKNNWFSCRKINSCSYRGEMSDNGMPHGKGFLMDNSEDGEMLKGNFVNGKPVAPFVSNKNNGSTSKAILLIYVMVGDDEFDKHKFNPTTEKPMRCGVASVECSVQGEFLRFLPIAEICLGPFVLNEEITIADCCSKLENPDRHEGLNSVTVSIHNDTGLKVFNHEPTTFDGSRRTNPNQVVINLISKHSNGQSTSDSNVEKRPMPQVLTNTNDYEEDRHNTSYLQIDNWVPVTHKDALVIFPGCNCSVEQGLNMWGQFMAMTNLCNHVYPIVFGWPGGKLRGYWRASLKGAQSQVTRDRLVEVIDGIHASGIRKVHFISHSMGVQTLLSAFQNKSDDSPSELARRFFPSVGFLKGHENEEDRITCNTITLLNPDFPVAAFIDHAFISLRQICNHITVVGDRNDTPLSISFRMNALAYFFGKKFTPLLLPNSDKKVSFATIGVYFDLLYQDMEFNEEFDSTTTESNDRSNDLDERLQRGSFFKSRRSSLMFEGLEDKKWLDIDVIDTTSLDTNIKGIRHSSFQMNPILLKDLEDLIVTGNRASQRIALVHRIGNVFSYSHAPSYLAL